MSWMQKLYETYEKALTLPDLPKDERLLPISHVFQQAHIEILLDKNGKFLDAQVVKKEDTLVAATEDSAGRTNDGAPHPLCDKIQFVAGDYANFGGQKKTYFDDTINGKETRIGYFSLLSRWCRVFPHPKLEAVLKYVAKRSVVADLVHFGILCVNTDGRLLTSCPDADKTVPDIFKVLTKQKKNGVTVQDQGDAFVRWCVKIPGDQETHIWEDSEILESWIKFNETLQEKQGLCYVTGRNVTLGSKHPARVRHGGDKAKLISSNKTSGYTFLGRFTEADQACSVGYEVSQKAHCALRWLVKRQAFCNDDQVIVAWDVSGVEIPPITANSLEAFFSGEDGEVVETEQLEKGTMYGDLGQAYALKLRKRISGYRNKLEERSEIVVMGLDSSTPGRMAVTFYRELNGSEFWERLEDWHRSYAWMQHYAKEKQFVGAPSPKEIAAAAFGRRLNSKLSKATIERLLPCVVDGVRVPEDLIRLTRHRATNRVSMEHWEWEKTLGIACALYKGFHKKEGYLMSLEVERKTRDYLYGRLLAVAERIESIALHISDEKRETNAARLMQRFSERPYTTWRQIEQSLVPYKSRIRNRRPGFLENMNSLLDEIHCMFETEEFMKDTPLSGEFLLAYHCQRRALRRKGKDEVEEGSVDILNNTKEEE